MKTVSLDQVGREQLALPPRVPEALGELVGSAKQGLLALSVGVGLGVLAELLEEEVVEVVGPLGGPLAPDHRATSARHLDRCANRVGSSAGSLSASQSRGGHRRRRLGRPLPGARFRAGNHLGVHDGAQGGGCPAPAQLSAAEALGRVPAAEPRLGDRLRHRDCGLARLRGRPSAGSAEPGPGR